MILEGSSTGSTGHFQTLHLPSLSFCLKYDRLCIAYIAQIRCHNLPLTCTGNDINSAPHCCRCKPACLYLIMTVGI